MKLPLEVSCRLDGAFSECQQSYWQKLCFIYIGYDKRIVYSGQLLYIRVNQSTHRTKTLKNSSFCNNIRIHISSKLIFEPPADFISPFSVQDRQDPPAISLLFLGQDLYIGCTLCPLESLLCSWLLCYFNLYQSCGETQKCKSMLKYTVNNRPQGLQIIVWHWWTRDFPCLLQV